MEVLKAGTGVVGGAPPATVDIVYCCAHATGLLASSRVQHNFTPGLSMFRSVLTIYESEFPL
jgi:hypothetical protein